MGLSTRLSKKNELFGLTQLYHYRGQYESKFQFSFTPYKVSQWVNDVPLLGEAGPRLKSRYIFSKYVYAALLKFIASDSPELTEQHLKIDAFDADCADLVCGSFFIL